MTVHFKIASTRRDAGGDTILAMSKALITVLLLIGSNCFMTWAWYGHLKKTGWTIPVAIGISWLIAFPEYLLQVPANRIGHISQGGPFTAAQLKILQEAITMTVFIVFAIVVLKEKPRWNEGVAFVLIFAGVVVAMMGRAPVVGAVAPPTQSEPDARAQP
jgi:uncharacterized protein (DUF486 family)